jgi:hypothetical protein
MGALYITAAFRYELGSLVRHIEKGDVSVEGLREAHS